MTSDASVGLSCILTCMLVAVTTDAPAQGRGRVGSPPPFQGSGPLPIDPLTGPVVTNAPYSGDGVTTITQTLGDGTRIEQRTEAKFYRDSAGRIRREQTILGLAALNPSAQAQTVVTIDPAPDGAFAYTLDPAARTARRVPRAFRIRLYGAGFDWGDGGLVAFGGNQGLVISRPGTPVGARQAEESLGTRQIEGVNATGRRTTSTIPAGLIGNDRPIEITDERWESPELKVLVYSRYSDPRTGVVDYRLTNISRAEPPPDLFAVPADYTILDFGTGGLRGGRVGGQGSASASLTATPSPPPPAARPAWADGVLHVGDGISAPTKLKDVRPVYPPIASAARVQGTVIVEARIEPDGRVSNARILRSIPLLDQAALDAVRQWVYTPWSLNGQAIPVIMTMTVNFSLQ